MSAESIKVPEPERDDEQEIVEDTKTQEGLSEDELSSLKTRLIEQLVPRKIIPDKRQARQLVDLLGSTPAGAQRVALDKIESILISAPGEFDANRKGQKRVRRARGLELREIKAELNQAKMAEVGLGSPDAIEDFADKLDELSQRANGNSVSNETSPLLNTKDGVDRKEHPFKKETTPINPPLDRPALLRELEKKGYLHFAPQNRTSPELKKESNQKEPENQEDLQTISYEDALEVLEKIKFKKWSVDRWEKDISSMPVDLRETAEGALSRIVGFYKEQIKRYSTGRRRNRASFPHHFQKDLLISPLENLQKTMVGVAKRRKEREKPVTHGKTFVETRDEERAKQVGGGYSGETMDEFKARLRNEYKILPSEKGLGIERKEKLERQLDTLEKTEIVLDRMLHEIEEQGIDEIEVPSTDKKYNKAQLERFLESVQKQIVYTHEELKYTFDPLETEPGTRLRMHNKEYIQNDDSGTREAEESESMLSRYREIKDRVVKLPDSEEKRKLNSLDGPIFDLSFDVQFLEKGTLSTEKKENFLRTLDEIEIQVSKLESVLEQIDDVAGVGSIEGEPTVKVSPEELAGQIRDRGSTGETPGITFEDTAQERLAELRRKGLITYEVLGEVEAEGIIIEADGSIKVWNQDEGELEEVSGEKFEMLVEKIEAACESSDESSGEHSGESSIENIEGENVARDILDFLSGELGVDLGVDNNEGDESTTVSSAGTSESTEGDGHTEEILKFLSRGSKGRDFAVGALMTAFAVRYGKPLLRKLLESRK